MLTTPPKNTKYETVSSEGQREDNSGKKTSGTSLTINATASQRVQCGTNRPLGKRKKKSTGLTLPTMSTLRTGNHQAGWEEIKVYAAVWSTETGPKDTRNTETSHAIRSSERRQKMSAPTAKNTSWKTLSTTTLRSAYERNDSPVSPNVCTPSGVACPTARSAQTSEAAVHTL